MLRNRMRSILLLVPLIGLAGCAFHRDHNPHNDVLVFATQTKFGVDVSAPVTNAAIPAFNVGYNRTEAVWMPLRPNGATDATSQGEALNEVVGLLNDCMMQLDDSIGDSDDRTRTCLQLVVPSGKYVSIGSGVDEDIGGSNLEIDAYSVFASFGARGGISGSGANGGLAQVFATGIAAQRLASNPQVGNALNTAAPSAQVEEAKARQDEAAVEARRLELTPEQRPVVQESVTSYLEFRQGMVGLIATTLSGEWPGRWSRFQNQAGETFSCNSQAECENAFRNGTPFSFQFSPGQSSESLVTAKNNWNDPLEGE